MKLISILLTTVISTNVFGQEKQIDIPTSDFKQVQIGVNFSPDFCFRTLKNNDGSSISDIVLNLRNENETIKFGYTTGLNICFNFKKFVALETGIQYSNKGYQALMKDLTYGDMIDPRYGFIYATSGTAPTKAKFIYNYHYIDIPLKVNFTFGKKKIRLISSVGLTTNIFIKETSASVLEYSDGKTDRKNYPTTFDYNKINISPIISVGIDYKINNRMNLRIEPTFRYGVLKIINTPIIGYLWNGGLNIGYYFGL